MAPAPDATTFTEVRAALRRPDFFKLQKWTDLKMFADRKGAHPDILRFEKVFLARLQSLGMPFYAHCVMRSREQQWALYRAGRSKAKPGLSAHQHGYAIDIVHCVHHWELPGGEKAWRALGAVGKEVAAQNSIDIEWGGDWKFWDPAHWQLRDWKRLADL